MKIPDNKQFSGEIITAEEILLKFLENRSISQFFEKLLMFCGSVKTYAKCIVANEPLVIKFALLHKYLFSRDDSFPNISRYPNISNKVYFMFLTFHGNKESLSEFFHAFPALQLLILQKLCISQQSPRTFPTKQFSFR